MSTHIHPSAVVDPAARLGERVEIGPFCVVGGDVQLGDDVRLTSHVVIEGRTGIGAGTIVYPFVSLGLPPQDLKYKGEPSELKIGQRCRIREHVTMNPGTEGGGMLTEVGDDGLFMVGAHVAHDCRIGARAVIANNVLLGGHVVIGDFVTIGGGAAVHQWVRIGDHAMIGGLSGVEQDVIPYGLVMGERARLQGLNLVGLERRGFPRETINDLRRAFRLMFGPEGTLAERMEGVQQSFGHHAQVAQILGFAQERSSRGLCLPRQG